MRQYPTLTILLLLLYGKYDFHNYHIQFSKCRATKSYLHNIVVISPIEQRNSTITHPERLFSTLYAAFFSAINFTVRMGSQIYSGFLRRLV